MILNELFRRICGGSFYYTPPAVMGELVNQGVGTVIITPPYRSKPRVWRKGWARRLKLGRLYFYISNCRMKKRPIRDLMYNGATKHHIVENKRKLYEQQGGKCPHCGQPFEYEQLELHHILPLSRFPELGQSIRNGVMLCHCCHMEIHFNPWKNIELMKAKADELGIDLKERYDYDEEDIKRAES